MKDKVEIKKEIFVSVVGTPGSGKSTISQIIIQALGRAGIEAISVNSDGKMDTESYLHSDLQELRVHSLSTYADKILVKQTRIAPKAFCKNKKTIEIER
ncbi:MAG: hypothetical protein M0R32_11545 [Candidatus Cloacimonetes bacterium]|jgi:ABC-type oligopeptide transport system ATPase subunit|nr:hypothetical protein [Candidatus Cloacimonadota bacterium]